MTADDPRFAAAWESLLRRIGALLQEEAARER